MYNNIPEDRRALYNYYFGGEEENLEEENGEDIPD